MHKAYWIKFSVIAEQKFNILESLLQKTIVQIINELNNALISAADLSIFKATQDKKSYEWCSEETKKALTQIKYVFNKLKEDKIIHNLKLRSKDNGQQLENAQNLLDGPYDKTQYLL